MPGTTEVRIFGIGSSIVFGVKFGCGFWAGEATEFDVIGSVCLDSFGVGNMGGGMFEVGFRVDGGDGSGGVDDAGCLEIRNHLLDILIICIHHCGEEEFRLKIGTALIPLIGLEQLREEEDRN
ncbi:hypothetical protein QVD17_00164 [Tagetes erecta]|uniref:Uncharacterized protein n=1 Tax=Tagetes erecta TaxID=13708 RepID=A0AAD8L5A5_TARER|nr:hypothetical protein QVD17_00164 [Tagetes erecta]